MIKFNNTEESLVPLLDKLKPATMHFHEKVEDKAEEILDELPGDFRRQDKNEGTNNSAQFAMLLDMMKEQNKNL